MLIHTRNSLSFVFTTAILLLMFVVSPSIVSAQEVTATPTPTPTNNNSQQISDLQSKISDLQNKITETQKTGKTLSSQISAMDNQVKLTELRITTTKQQIDDLTDDINTTTKKITHLEESLDDLTKVLLNRVVATYKSGSIDTLEVIAAADSAAEVFSRANYLRLVQEHDKQLLYETQQAKNDYANQKAIFEEKKQKVEALKAQLEGYTAQLAKDKKAKQDLLASTQNDEARYQKMLREAQAQINAFKSFTSAAALTGGSILPAQASPDGWYYNQRDERWGRNLIGSSPEQVWDVGCLLTSVAMVLKKNGFGVSPADVASSPYFWSNTAMMNLPWGGGRFSSSWGFDQGAIDSKLASGQPVIVGVKAGTYGMHFVVLKSGSGGSYVMNDPWYGPDLPFNSHYSTSLIFQYGYYNG